MFSSHGTVLKYLKEYTMIGAILGDIAGSIHENIPKLKQTRKTPCATDDSILTCACKEWTQSLSKEHVSRLEKDNAVWNYFSESAVLFLKKWGRSFPASGFSKGFLKWVETDPYEKTNKNTNGCLMRQSPIAEYCIDNKISLNHALMLSEIFASVSHNDEEAIAAVKKHTTWIYGLLGKSLNLDMLKNELKQNCNIQSIEFWFGENQKKFIWDAKTSLDIATSCVYFAKSYEEAINNCIKCSGDTDTYAAIAGPMAQALWGIKRTTVNDLGKYIQFDEIKRMWEKELKV